MNINLDKQLLEAIRLADDRKQLDTVRIVLSRIEGQPSRRNSRPIRNIIRKIVKRLSHNEEFAEETKLLKLRLKILSEGRRQRTPKHIAPLTASSIVDQIQSVTEILSGSSYEPAGPIILLDGTSFRCCVRCRMHFFCRRVFNDWTCFDCLSREQEAAAKAAPSHTLEPPTRQPDLRSNVPIQLPRLPSNPPREVLAAFQKSAPDPRRTEQLKAEKAEAMRRRAEADEYRRLAATPIDELTFEERRRLVGL